MRFGIALGQYGPFAEPDAVTSMALGAEELDFDSLWVGDRLLFPHQPRDGYGGYAGVPWPPGQRRFLDPLGALTLAATKTHRVRLGTHVLVAPFYTPLVLARSLTTLDLISGGRLDVGLGTGWSRDEFAAAGIPWQERGARMEETLDVLDVAWQADTVQHTGRLWDIVPSTIDLKPLQRPRPPLYLAGATPKALDRVARRADGWVPAGLPAPLLAPLWTALKEAAARHGRDPASLRVIYRANPVVTAEPQGPGRRPFRGSLDEVGEDLAAVARLGVDEILVGLQGSAETVPDLLEVARRLRATLGTVKTPGP